MILVVFPAEFGVGFTPFFTSHTDWQWCGPDDVCSMNKDFVKGWWNVVPGAINHVLSQSCITKLFKFVSIIVVGTSKSSADDVKVGNKNGGNSTNLSKSVGIGKCFSGDISGVGVAKSTLPSLINNQTQLSLKGLLHSEGVCSNRWFVSFFNPELLNFLFVGNVQQGWHATVGWHGTETAWIFQQTVLAPLSVELE